MSTTTNYGWTLPTVGGDDDDWGDVLNAMAAAIDADLKTVSNAQNTLTVATFATSLKKVGGGQVPYFASSGNTGGAITVSTSAPSGTPASGDIWIQYTP